MELKNRVVIIDEKNFSRLTKLYDGIKDIDELSRVVNNHLSVAIDEIEEDCSRSCKFQKVILQPKM